MTNPHLTSAIQTLNAKISSYDYEIRSTRNQHTKIRTYALVNKTSDDLTQLATKFSASEIGYIRRVLDFMFETNNTKVRETMAIKHADASQQARVKRSRQSQVNADGDEETEPTQSADPGISIQEADDVLAELENEGFFQKSKAGYYSLAPRALMELRAYLKETYNEEDDIRIRDCEGCTEIVTHGIRCDNKECEVRWHDACANSYYKGRDKVDRKCPQCTTVCTGLAFVGERADRVGPQSGTSGGARQSGGRRRAEEVDEDEEDDE